ncbi:cytochrome c maturation protein CcmE [Danxiaibacter flavus]|uniref:Cytochrome c maturation protein CcmE n=1 Tax=Danxiaibacter flavus TaxID=3049108 RepID=A0ABV3ZB78_9BACT|nr:cytochrome c maturation protein CcmE [Chitinophagaceae bacterium DXS]
MKKTHIIALVFIAIAIAVLISYIGDVSTYDSFASAQKKEGKFVRLAAKIDKSKPFVYDPVKDPNYLAFTAIDTLGNTMEVVYHNTKPTDMEKSERLVLGGKVKDGKFECKDILLKCPSKYKDNPDAIKHDLDAATKND